MDRRRFSKEFKIEAVRMLRGGERRVVEVAHELGIHPDVLRKWRKSLEKEGEGAFPGSGGVREKDEELVRLRRENSRLREEREILKKAMAIFSGNRLR